MRARARAKRCAKFAISLPSVVGEAAWPCVRESIARLACFLANPFNVSISCSSFGSITFSRASAIISA